MIRLGWGVFRAMIDCEYKAWQLLQSDNHNFNLPDSDDKKNKLAIAAAKYPEMKESQAEQLYVRVSHLILKNESPVFYKNAHCQHCPSWTRCYPKLKEKDCISLLGNISPITITKYHKKGIFTILQLSHLFRLRRKRNRPHLTGGYLWELKSLAIREKKTYVLQVPDIAASDIEIYIDFEGLPDDNFIYLIGVIIKANEEEKRTSFWADNEDEELTIFSQTLALLNEYPDAIIFHYGSYETKGFKKWEKLFEEQFTFKHRMVNLLSYFRSHVYPPTYTNSLKEIARYLNFEWRDREASGLKSIEWRRNWVQTKDDKYKQQLLEYNEDDLGALIKVKEWLIQLRNDEDTVQHVSKMKKQSPYRWQHNSHYSEDFSYINKAAYFDYQHAKIYWRNKTVTKTKETTVHFGRGHAVWKPQKANEIIQLPQLKICPHCGHRKLYHLVNQRSFRQTDLKFTSKGIKQWVIEYRSGKGKCARCAMKYNDSVLKRMHLGDNLMAWAINMYVTYKISFSLISTLLQEQFGIWTNPTYFNDRNYIWWQRFKPEVSYCWQIILNSPVMHIDETTVRLAKGKDRGYVWAFATTHTIFYHLTLNREATFLHDWLKDYKGVIITDFFAGYESLKVKHQKCLIHLIRDLNDDLLKHPFDEEYKKIVIAFGSLLKLIVATIDRYGLKKKHLQKHKKDTARFYKTFIDSDYTGELSTKYAKRLKKHWSELWTFLDYDGVPWNNNNAEVAIKAFAQHRRGVNGQVSEKGLTEYLTMLTIAQTCRYRKLSFLNFLLGNTGIWENIHSSLLPGHLPYNQAKLFMKKIKLSSRQDWLTWKDTSKRPTFIPPEPDKLYKDTGWIDWQNWIGN